MKNNKTYIILEKWYEIENNELVYVGWDYNIEFDKISAMKLALSKTTDLMEVFVIDIPNDFLEELQDRSDSVFDYVIDERSDYLYKHLIEGSF